MPGCEHLCAEAQAGRVIGLDIKTGEKISNMSKEISEKLNSKFTPPHLTLCRVKNIDNKNKVREFYNKNSKIDCGELVINSISLVKSKLTPKGPIYETIHKSSLID